MIGDVWFSSRPGTTRHEEDGGEQGAGSKEQGARSEETSEMRNAEPAFANYGAAGAERPTQKSVSRLR
jgi:hypothetical protein